MRRDYHKANFQLTSLSLQTFLSGYVRNEHDESLEDPISLCTQAELLAEAASTALPSCIEDALRLVPIVCRTITMDRPLYPGMLMNPWLGKVVALPTIVRFATTTDYMERLRDRRSHGELINCAMLVTRHPTGSICSQGAGKHMSSYLLYGEPQLYHTDSDLATWAMVVVHILTQPTRFEWMKEDLSLIRDMHSKVYHHEHLSWRRYLDLVASQDFRLGLVTMHKSLPVWCRCPHLNKFLLAVFLLSDRLTPEEMAERRRCVIKEFLGRMFSAGMLLHFTKCKYNMEPRDVLESVPFEFCFTQQESVKRYLSKLKKFDWCSVKIMEMSEPSADSAYCPHMNLSCNTISNFFDALCPGMEPLTDSEWQGILSVCLEGRDSYSRNTELVVQRQLYSELEYHHLKQFRKKVFQQAESFATSAHCACLIVTHHEQPMLVSADNAARYLEKHGRDLRQELCLNDSGMSAVACLCPHCPYFARCTSEHQLSEHNDHSNELMQIIHENFQCSDPEIADKYLQTQPLRRRVLSRTALCMRINRIRQPVPWETFEGYFSKRSSAQTVAVRVNMPYLKMGENVRTL